MTVRWCQNIAHLLESHEQRGKCKACVRQTNRRTIARRDDRGFCEAERHGKVGDNVADDGSCAECAREEATFLAHVRPVPTTWLDWAAVVQALQGRPLTRPLSQREVLCLVTTIKDRHGWSRKKIAAWVAENTFVEGATEVYIEYLEHNWWKRRNLPDPRITVEQAIYEEVDGDDWVKNYAQAARAQEAEVEAAAVAPAAEPAEVYERILPPADRRPRVLNRDLGDGRRRCKLCAGTKHRSEFPMVGDGPQVGMRRSSYCEPCYRGQRTEENYRRQARKVGVPVTKVVIGRGPQRVTSETVIAQYGDACFYAYDGCKGTYDEVSHYVSVRDHGPHTLDNVRPSCKSCTQAHRRMSAAEAA